MSPLPHEETPIFDALTKEYASKEAYELHFNQKETQD